MKLAFEGGAHSAPHGIALLGRVRGKAPPQPGRLLMPAGKPMGYDATGRSEEPLFVAHHPKNLATVRNDVRSMLLVRWLSLRVCSRRFLLRSISACLSIPGRL